MFKDYYKILGISRTATAQEIKSAYHVQSKKWHPDMNPDKDVTDIMRDINEAYSILKDQLKRERYNQEYDIFFTEVSPSRVGQSKTDEANGFEYDYEPTDETLRNDIAEARQYARDLVDEFLKKFKEASKSAAKGAKGAVKGSLLYAVAWILSGALLGSLTTALRSCNT